MKFGKLLQSTSVDLPVSGSLFLRYKTLKKQLKAIQQGPGGKQGDGVEGEQGNGHARPMALSEEEKKFIDTLNEDLGKFNNFFMDKEEDSVIRLQVLQDQVQKTATPEQARQCVAELVDFHGEMVLLLHWSFLNYAAIVKILKKHDKHTGLFLRAPYVATLLKQPFFSTTVLTRLVKQAEAHIQELVSTMGLPEQQLCSVPQAAEPIPDDGVLLRHTKAALEVWRQLSSTASTPSTVLPADTLQKLTGGDNTPSSQQQQQQHKRPFEHSEETAPETQDESEELHTQEGEAPAAAVPQTHAEDSIRACKRVRTVEVEAL